MSTVDTSLSASRSSTLGAQTGGTMQVGGDRGLRYVLYGLLAVMALGLVLWFMKKKR